MRAALTVAGMVAFLGLAGVALLCGHLRPAAFDHVSRGLMSLLVGVALLAACTAAVAGPIVWTAPSLVRVGREDKAGAAASIDLAAARGEYESFQVVVQAPAGGLTNVNVTASELRREHATIPPSQLTLYREHYLEVKTATPYADRGENPSLGPGWYADALIPFLDPATGQPPKKAVYTAAPFDLEAGRNQPIWVDLLVPRAAEAGPYTGTLTVTSDQGQAQVTLHLKVWDFDLPRAPALKSWFGINAARRAAAGPELLRHRLMPDEAPPGLERAWIDQYGLNCIDLGIGSGAYISRLEMRPAPSVEEFRQAAARHERDLLLYNYTADEIGGNTELYEGIRQWARNLHQAGIKNLITITPEEGLLDDGSGTGRSAVDIWVLLPLMYDGAPGPVAQALAKGDEVWSYTALAQDEYSPKWEVDFAPINYRIMGGFISQSLGLTGLLYWKVDLWSEDPYTIMSAYAHEAGPFPGEGMLVYPGEPVGVSGVVGSMRLKYLRDSADDYDYLEMLKRLGRGERALEIARTVGPDWRHWNHDPAALEAARQRLGDEIEAALAKVRGPLTAR